MASVCLFVTFRHHPILSNFFEICFIFWNFFSSIFWDLFLIFVKTFFQFFNFFPLFFNSPPHLSIVLFNFFQFVFFFFNFDNFFLQFFSNFPSKCTQPKLQCLSNLGPPPSDEDDNNGEDDEDVDDEDDDGKRAVGSNQCDWEGRTSLSFTTNWTSLRRKSLKKRQEFSTLKLAGEKKTLSSFDIWQLVHYIFIQKHRL